ncbi:hypothetical protein PV325_004506 [Microctonus aethiopoides]|nr:hypothetical protein PV325_004506 [Microctonus aethiopoides]KAK0081119.1 hypothetical protein PV326_007846 [Microctonus aethiopoides]
MSSEEVLKYWEYRNTIKFLLVLVGLWPSENPSRVPRLLSYISLFLSAYTSFGIAGYARLNFTNIHLVTKSLSIMGSFLAVVLKLMSIIIHREDLNVLHKFLDPHFNKLLNDPLTSSLVLNGLQIRRNLALTLTLLLLFVSFTYPATCFISIAQQYFHRIHPITFSLPYPTVYPWSINPTKFYIIIQSLIETAATVPLFCVSAGVDSLFSLYGFQMIGQLREMTYRMTHIEKITDDGTLVRECVLQHFTIMKCRDILQKIYGPPILWIMTTNAIVLCNVIFQFSQMNVISISRITWISAYVALKIIQTFMYAWTGTCLTTEDENYKNAIYSSDWHRNKYFMTSVLIILTQRPLILTVCDFAIVSLGIFTSVSSQFQYFSEIKSSESVLNTTVSYYFLLQTLQETPSVIS